MSGSGARSLSAAAALVAATLYPPVASLLDQAVRAVFAYFAADSFYYLTVARNALDGPLSSYDGATLTNGYHPLWQLLLVTLFRVTGAGQPAQLVGTFLVSAALVTGGLVLFQRAIARVSGSAWMGLWMIPGILHVAFSVHSPASVDPGLTYTYSPWAMINGMETPLTVLFGGALALLLARAGAGGASPAQWPARTLLALGVVVALATLARLDDGFLAIAFIPFLLAGPGGWSARLRRTAVFLAPGAALIGAYLLVNLVAFGLLLPVSGQVKAGWPLLANLGIVLTDLFPPSRFLLGSDYDLPGWIYSAQRTVLLVAPALLATGVLAYLRATRREPGVTSRRLAPFAPLAVYVLLKALYNLARVEVAQQGYWYFALPLLVFDLFAVVLLDRAFRGRWPRRALAAAWGILFLITSANALHRASITPWTHDVWARRDKLRAGILERRPDARLIGFYDGLFAYSLDLPTVPATALTTDREGLAAVRAGEYPRHCLSRGYDVAVWSPRGYPISREWLRTGEPRELWRDEATGVTFTELRRAR